ncbi:MAG: hypothetical protein IKM59_02130 [Oscillospiraceae bacterium]|nr:hypothetical protein [Oscillospiraceae bacterium]
MTTKNKAASKYLRHVRGLLPVSARMKKKLMTQIYQEIRLFSEEQPQAKYEDLLSRFGAPEVIAAACVESMGTAEVLKKIRIRKWILSAVSAVLIFIVLAWAAVVIHGFIVNNRNVDCFTEVISSNNTSIETNIP